MISQPPAPKYVKDLAVVRLKKACFIQSNGVACSAHSVWFDDIMVEV